MPPVWSSEDRARAFAPRENGELSVEEAMFEAMNSSQQRPSIETSRPQPHLPLRKASAQKLQARRHAPQPLFAPSLRGFNPVAVQPLPHIDAVTASTEHAFAGRDARKPSKLPLGSLALRHGQEQRIHRAERAIPIVTDPDLLLPHPHSPLLPPPPMSPGEQSRRLRGSRSLGEGLRHLKHRLSNHDRTPPKYGGDTPDSVSPGLSTATDEVRASFRTALTSSSSLVNADSLNSDDSSLVRGDSSHSDFVQVYPQWPLTEAERDSMTVDDAIGMYTDGFESAKQSLDMHVKHSLQVERPSSQPIDKPRQSPRAKAHRRSQSAGLLMDTWKTSAPVTNLAPPEISRTRTSLQIIGNGDSRASHESGRQRVPTEPQSVPRDRYGFKIVSRDVSLEKYNAWNAQYSEHLDRRTKKWQVLMRQYGLNWDKPYRFPARSDKVKRYVRKGIPPHLRAAAWFWYAGGPARLKKDPDLYIDLLEQVANGKLSENDREHIERDLNRTFPDNVRFKPDPATMSDVQTVAGGGQNGRPRAEPDEPEMPIVQALRRVLQAFAVHNPDIGYCQSMNFIAGLLLLFLQDDDEVEIKAFTLLEIVTSTHLPGTHGVALEGANIDIAVLISCVKDSLPAVWARLDDQGGAPLPSATTASATTVPLRLPTISLATTAWFMSLFVGTLPIESVLRVWDCLFFEGSKTLFRIALAIFKACEREILAVNDPMEVFQVVQTTPRSMLDVNGLMEVCFRRRGGFGHVSQELVERRREERRRDVKKEVGSMGVGIGRWKGRWRAKTRAV